jgi:hypothetical protein
MPDLVLTDEQANVIRQAGVNTVKVLDAAGNFLGAIEPENNQEFIAELKRRGQSPGPWYSGEQVAARLHALHTEWDRTGGFDKAYMDKYLDQLEKVDPARYGPRGKAS